MHDDRLFLFTQTFELLLQFQILQVLCHLISKLLLFALKVIQIDVDGGGLYVNGFSEVFDRTFRILLLACIIWLFGLVSITL